MVDALAAIKEASVVLGYANPGEPVIVDAITTPTIGRSGWDTATMAPQVFGWINQTSPDIVTLNIGLNDGYFPTDEAAQDAVVSRIGGIVDNIIASRPGVAVFVSNFERAIDPMPTMKAKIQNMVQIKFTARNKVYFVASYSRVTSAMYFDEVHPTDIGRDIIMQNWTNAIKDYVTGKLPLPN